MQFISPSTVRNRSMNLRPRGGGEAVSQAVLGEFDPGSGRTLAACLTHASRAERPLRGYSSGERVSNTWVICPRHRNNRGKPRLMPVVVRPPGGRGKKGFSPPGFGRPPAPFFFWGGNPPPK